MSKSTEKKRKLEQGQADATTPKRLKQTRAESSKEAAATPIGGNDSPLVLVSRTEQDAEHNGTPKISKAERKAAKKARRSIVQDLQTTPGAQLRAESDDVVTPVEKAKVIEKELVNGQHQEQEAQNSKSKADKKRRKSKQGKQLDIASTDAAADTKTHTDGADEAVRNAAEKKARRKANREDQMAVAHADERKETLPPVERGWSLSKPSAGRYIAHDPIFVMDEHGSPFIIAATRSEVQLLSQNTSLLVRSHALPAGRHVVAFAESAVDQQIVDIAYDNGAKIQWNWTTSESVHGTFPGQESVIAMANSIMSDKQSELFYIAEADGEYSVVGERRVLNTTNRRLNDIQVLHEGAYIVCTSGGAILIGARKDPAPQAEYTWVDVPIGAPVRCADAKLIFKEPSKKKQTRRPELMLAVGTAEGKIYLYSDLSSIFKAGSELPTPQVLHWHRKEVSSVKFSRDGNYVVSGGKETVLVMWQLETGKKQYLPHLTAEIERIVVSPEGARYALQMGDNSIMVLSTSELKPVANFAGIQLSLLTGLLAAEDAILPRPSALLHPQDQHKLLLTVPATQPKSTRDISTRPFVQTYDIRNSRHLSRQALTRNNVTDFNTSPDGTPIVPPDVSLIAVSPDGQWMASVDEWEIPATDLEHVVPKTSELDLEDILELDEEKQRRREVYIKFWRWDAAQSLWTLSTKAEAPHCATANDEPKHGAGRVLKLVADPSSNRFATIGQDSVVKIWTPRKRLRGGELVKEADGTDAVDYACKRMTPIPITTIVSSTTPADRHDSPMEVLDENGRPLYLHDAALAFSSDGSMLACVQVAENETAPVVHFIETDTCILKSSKHGLIIPEQEILDIGFLEQYLITLSTGAVRVWNLVNDDAQFTVSLQGKGVEQTEAMLAINHVDGTFAVVSYDIHDINDPQPKFTLYNPKTPTALYEFYLNPTPVALLTPMNASGYTILYEDGTIRTLSSTTYLSSAIALPTTDDPTTVPLALPSAETTSALALAEDVEMEHVGGSAFTSGEVTAAPRAIEDDRPVVRPEQLNAILDVGQAFAMPALTEMFQSLSTLHSRAPRRRKQVVEA